MKLNKTDYDDINMLINIISSIYDNFQKLSKLEMQGEKNTEEYLACLSEIKRDLIYKDNCFDRISATPEKCLAIANYLKKESVLKDSHFAKTPSLVFVVSLRPFSKKDIILGCILNQLTKKVLENSKFMLSMEEKKLELPEELLEKSKNFFSFQTLFQSFLITDMYSLLLALNERRIYTANNEKIKESAIKTKYQLGFLIPDIMNSLINEKFDVELNPFLINFTASKIYPVPNEIEELIKRMFLLEQAKKCINILACNLDYNLIDPENMAIALNVQDMLRSILIISDKTTADAIVNEIKSCLKAISDSNMQIKWNITRKMFEDILSYLEEDKMIPKIVSFGRL